MEPWAVLSLGLNIGPVQTHCNSQRDRQLWLFHRGNSWRHIWTRSIRSSAAPWSMACRCGRDRGRAAAGHRRRGLGQDQHAGAPRRAPDRQRRRSAPHPADDLLAPRRRRRWRGGSSASRGSVLGGNAAHHDRRAHLGRHVPRHRRAAAARLCRADRPRSGLHHPRPRGLRRPDEPRPARARLLEDGEPLSDQGHLPRDLFALRSTPRRRSTRCCGAAFPWCAGWAGRAAASCSPPMSRPSSARTCSITTTCCSTGRR